MRLGLLISLAALPLSTVAWAQYKNDPVDGRPDVGWVEAIDPEVNAAIAKSRETLPDLLEALADPDAFNITFKFPLGGFEHIWVTKVRRDGDYLTGVLDNVPVQEGWAKGDTVRVPIADVSDYFYCDADNNPHGHYTTAVFLDREEGKGFMASVMSKLCEVRVERNAYE